MAYKCHDCGNGINFNHQGCDVNKNCAFKALDRLSHGECCLDENSANDVQIIYNALKNRNAKLQDFACKVSQLVWSGELGWTKSDDGLDMLFSALTAFLNEKSIEKSRAPIGDKNDVK